ncbi:MAG: glucose 1-dehydrogenase [Pseudomonadota bacterium]
MLDAPLSGGRLQGKTAVITGGSSGLGLATAKQFVAQGARVLITGSNPEKLLKAKEEIGASVTTQVADVCSSSDLAALVTTAKKTLGTVDVLFANAGVGTFAPVSDVSEKDFDWLFNTNVKGVFFTVQHLAPLMTAGGSIILNASATHGRGKAGGSIYFATKAAVRSFARTMADEYGPLGIRVNALSPGLVQTGFQARTGLPEEALGGFGQYVVDTAPMSRLGTPDEIARAAIFLASDDSSYMTAADLVVDGGYMGV